VRENRTHGSEGGEDIVLPYPYLPDYHVADIFGQICGHTAAIYPLNLRKNSTNNAITPKPSQFTREFYRKAQ